MDSISPNRPPPIPPSAFDEIIKELHERPITINKYRDKCGEGRSQCFGLVNRRSLDVDYSRQGWLRPKLLYHVQEFANKYVDISWTSVTINQNYKCLPHRDKGNYGESYLVACGEFTGGELQILEGDLSGSYNINCRPFKTDFSKVLHSVQDFTGTRISLVFYKLKSTKMPTEPLPEGKAVFENGKYVFKRGGKVITAKEGLSHPLRGRKKEVMTKNVSLGDFIVTFD
jgi:hypothetical protein